MLDENDIKDLDLEAFIDDEITSEEAEMVRKSIENSPELRRKSEKLGRQKQLLQSWWRQFCNEH